jgi:lysozyme
VRRLAFDYAQVEAKTKRREGLRLKMYRDSVGVWTIGWGHNLEARPISRRAAQVILEDDLADVEDELLAAFPWVTELDPVRQAAVFDMCFNMGAETLQEFNAEPNGSLPRIRRGEFLEAGAQLRRTLWYRQTGLRAENVILMIETGEL